MNDAAPASSGRRLSRRALDARLSALQAQAFALYETAAARAEAAPADAGAIYAGAERDTAPLIAEAKALNDERVRRLRRRARGWRVAAFAIAVVGLAVVAWLLAARR